MQNTKKAPRTLHAIDSWLLSHAQALVAYAQTDDDFACSLVHHVLVRHWRPNDSLSLDFESNYTAPLDQNDAVLTTHWLLSTLDERPEAIRTRGMLATYAYEFESPKDVFIGIVGLAIMGPTLGILEKKKKHTSQMHVVINETWYKKHSAKQLTELVQNLSQKVVSQEIRYAGGNAFRLHPDTATWCLEEPITELCLASKNEITKVKTAARSEKLSFDLKPGIAIAISPTVNDTFLQEFDVREME